MIWEYLDLVRVYCKPKGQVQTRLFVCALSERVGQLQAPDLSEPVILRRDSSVLSGEMQVQNIGKPIQDFRGQLPVCRYIHRELERSFNYALIWGTSVKHRPQRVGKKHILEDEVDGCCGGIGSISFFLPSGCGANYAKNVVRCWSVACCQWKPQMDAPFESENTSMANTVEIILQQ